MILKANSTSHRKLSFFFTKKNYRVILKVRFFLFSGFYQEIYQVLAAFLLIVTRSCNSLMELYVMVCLDTNIFLFLLSIFLDFIFLFF